MAGIRLEGNTSGNVQEVDVNNNAKVNLPTTNTQAGFARITAAAASGDMRDLVISDEGHAYVAQSYQVFEKQWNSAATNWARDIGTNATTMTKATTAGFMRLNSGSITTASTGIALYSRRTFNIEESVELRVRMYLRHTNATVLNKQFDMGLGYYAFATGQAAAMNEFIGFRWTTTGGLQAVLETSAGGAPTPQTVNINGNLPYSDGVTREYELLILESEVYYYVNGTWVATISRDPTLWATTKAISLPWIARLFNTATALSPLLAPLFDLGEISIRRIGGNDTIPFSYIKSAMGNHSYEFQPDLGSSAQTHVFPASGTAPGAVVIAAATPALAATALGGYYKATLTGVTAVAHTVYEMAGYLNPAYPTAAGQASNARVFYVTGLMISPMVVSTALTGGGFVASWFASTGATALGVASTDADGTTAVAQKAPRVIPLSLVSTLAAAAALGTVSTDVGDHQFTFPTPIPVMPGEYFQVGIRTITATAITAGGVDGAISVNGYWE